MKKNYLLCIALMLFAFIVQGQITNSVTYDFRDGTIISAKQSTDGKLTLAGAYAYHGTSYGLDLKVNQEINIAVAGSCTIRFLGSVHSGLKMVGTASVSGDLGTQVTKVTTDKVDTYDFVYSGVARTLNFKTIAGTGGDTYLPKIEVISAQLGKDFTVAEKNIPYYFDLRDKSIVAASSNVTIDKGLFKLEAGCCNGYSLNGAQHGIEFKVGNKITLKVAGNSYIRVGADQYSVGTIAATSSNGVFDVTSRNNNTGATFSNETPLYVDFLYVGPAGTVTLEGIGNKVYIPYIEISPNPYDVSLSTYVQKSGTVTLNGVTINLTSGATAADNATITLSSGIVLSALADNGYVALDLGGNMATLTPTVSGDIASATISGNNLNITYANNSTDPKTYTIKLYDNSYLNGTTKYDFRDGTIISAKQSTDGLLTLGGAYSLHGPTYGLDLKPNQEMNITVAGTSALKFLGSQHSSLSMLGTATISGDLGTLATKVTTDLVDTYDFVYSGASKALNFKAVTPGSDVYLPSVSVIPAQMGAAYTAAVKNTPYFFDFRDGSIIPKITLGNIGINKGLVEIVSSSSNAYGYNGTQHGSVLKGGNQIKLQVAGNSYIKVGGSIFSRGTISVSSATGNFDKSSQSATTAANFDTNRTSVDFLYVGTAGVVTLDFTDTNYVPYIEVVPVTTPVSLTPWVQKAGTVTINGTVINFTAGADVSSNATVTVSSGTVISATNETASIQIPLNGKALSTYTPTLTGDIASVSADGNILILTFSEPTSNPKTYTLSIADNSVVVEAVAGQTYTYNFTNGTVLPQTSYQTLRYNTFTTSDGIVNLKSNTATDASKFGYHDATHGAVFFPGNSMDIIVAGNATVTFVVCTYGGKADGVIEFTDSNSNVLGSVAAQNIGGADGTAVSFTYTGAKGVITATLKSVSSTPTTEFYIHGMNIENAATIVPSNGKTDVWDFGAVTLDTALYNNQLTTTTINSWYNSSIVAGSSANALPSFTSGVLSWVGGSNDRLRTTNTNLTRYDENIAGAVDYTGRIYVNGAAASGRYMSLTLSADDEVTVFASTDSGGIVNFQYVADAASQTNQVSVPSTITELHFVAKQAGTYHIFDTQGKPSYYRILRKDATYKALTGNVDVTQASGIPGGYTIVFTNEAGKTWSSAVSSGTYNVNLPQGYTYALSLAGANGYVISNGNSLNVTSTTTTYDIAIQAVELYTVSGNVTGLGTDISKLTLTYTPDSAANKIYVPTPVINATNSTYTVQLEPNVEYTISGQGVNDYEILSNKITIANAPVVADVAFTAKPVYNIAINTTGLDATQLSKLALTFTNLNESGYEYNFSSVTGIALRNGVYTIAYSGLDEYPVEIGLISNLTVNGIATSKAFDFKPVTNWSFDDKVIANGDPAYKGLLFTGTVANEIAKGHLTTKTGATIKVPVNVGDKVAITYYYSADFSIEGGTAITTASKSTSTFENVEYSYTGSAPGFVTITVGSSADTTYFTNIAVGGSNAYKSVITVGTDKEYQTINAALSAVSKMTRTSSDRVTIMIDPGNYEEMLEITQANVTLKNAATTPNIDLINKGVDIKYGAVRITSYYGHGYNYYSMKNNQKWDADVLRVNKENGYLTYENKGSGTTNGSYWNATVVISANGFQADDIIFENSFNQYISKKESEDVVVMWASESPGLRPTTIGSTAVQNRPFVERAAALSIANNIDKVVLNKCRVVGRQDSFFGGVGSRVVVYKGVIMGAVDYIFGGMTAVFYKTDLAMNTCDVSGDESYLTAAQQGSSNPRGYLMYECNVTTAIPGTETASTYRSKPGYLGRPWEATTSEVVFYNTTIETSNYPGSEGLSLIKPLGWQNSLGGTSAKMYEYGTIEKSGIDNSSSRASWATKLSSPTLTDGTAITTLNFTKGSDGWDPIPQLVSSDLLAVKNHQAQSSVNVYAFKDNIVISNVTSNTKVSVYSINGLLIKSFQTNADANFSFNSGVWIVVVKDAEGQKSVKLMTY